MLLVLSACTCGTNDHSEAGLAILSVGRRPSERSRSETDTPVRGIKH